MNAEDVKFYRERWKAVEEIERQELRALSMDDRLQQMNMVWQLAKGLGFSIDADDEMEIFERWARLKEGK